MEAKPDDDNLQILCKDCHFCNSQAERERANHMQHIQLQIQQIIDKVYDIAHSAFATCESFVDTCAKHS